MSREELAKRPAEAYRMVLILRRATLDMRELGRHVLAERRPRGSAQVSADPSAEQDVTGAA
jgi:hypothetical protein